MKKKIINGIMMVALVAATSTSFVSCKDTNEDVRVEQAAEIAQLKGKLTTLENKYGDLDGRVSALSGRLDDVTVDVEALESEVMQLESWLVETFAKLVTSVELSGTYTNMVGSVNIPGFEPKMLISNYGVAEQKCEGFPLSAKDFDVEPITWAANEELGTGNGDNPGYAGYIYAAVNRYLNSVPLLSNDQDKDLGFFAFSLVNTAGDEAEGVEILNDNKDGDATDDVLQWGWTRAENNTFKFAVNYTGEEAKNFNPASINLKNLKEDLKTIWRDRDKKAFARTLADLYYNYATMDTKAAKYALKVAWKDNTEWQYEKDDNDKDVDDIVPGTDGLDHFVTSKHELVFATIKPLAFNSGDAIAQRSNAIKGQVNWAAEKGTKVLNKLFDKIKAQLPNLSPAQIGTISAGGNLTEAGGVWTLNITTGPGAGSNIDVTNIIAPLNADLATVKDMLAAAQALENKALNSGTYLQWVYKFTDKANSIIENNIDQALQPVLLALNNGVVNRVSGLKYAPYEASGEVTLKPTTYTLEFIAPAYAKFVGCKDIKEDNFNKILYSNSDELKFTPEPGKLYEIVYEAVDYYGNIVPNTYYILGK